MSNLRALLLLALDPGQILLAQGITPDPWQRRFFLCPGRQVLLNCSRQAGKSTVVAALALHTALFRPGSLTLLVSPSLRQSTELFRKVMEGYRALKRPIPAVSDSQTGLELTNRSRIVCLPGREDTIRSFSGVRLLILDEAARVPEDLYRSVRPMLAVSRGKLVCLSTPFGKRGFFYREWHEKSPAWSRFRVPWTDCPRITPEFIEEEKQSLGDSWVGQEYGCSFEALEGLVFPNFEERCAPTPGAAQDVALQANALGGIDFGFRNPFAAVWGFVDKDGILWIVGEHYAKEKTVLEHTRFLPEHVTWYADPAGAQEIATLRKLDFTVRKGRNDIAAGIAAIRARMETGRLKVLATCCPNLVAEAKLYRYAVHAPGQSESEIPVDNHNHALAALRYLVSRLDESFLARYRRQKADKTSPAKSAAARNPFLMNRGESSEIGWTSPFE